MARTIHHMPYDVQMLAAWGDTEPHVDIDPLTGEAWQSRFWKGPRRDRFVKGVGTIEHVPGARIGGSNPSAHREFLGRPRIIPTVDEFDFDAEAEETFFAEQAALDEMSRWFKDDEDYDAWYDHEYVYCPSCHGLCEV
jgi:hypothetical protein